MFDHAVHLAEHPRDLASVPFERLEAELCQLTAQSAAAMYRWLELVAEIDRRELAFQLGATSTAMWLAWRCALDGRTARDHVRVAVALRDLPLISAAFAIGQLTYSKVRALTRIATAETEQGLLDLAQPATASQLERIVRAYRHSERLRNEVATRQHEDREVVERWDDDGTYRVSGRLEPEEGSIVHAALERACDLLEADEKRVAESSTVTEGDDCGSAEPQSVRKVTPDPCRFAQRRADALALICESFLASGAAADDERYQVVVHATPDMLAAPPSGDGDGDSDDEPGPHARQRRCELDNDVPLSMRTLQRLGCDASILACIEDRDGNPLYLGRTTHEPNRAQRRALRIRDHNRCGWAGCDAQLRLHAHHVRWWARDRGPTDIDNLLLLCPFHHRLVHDHDYRIEAAGFQKFRFYRPDGTEIVGQPAHPATEVTLEEANAARGQRVADCPWSGDADPLDLGMAVDAIGTIMGTLRTL
jgi:hypothetical protein